MKTSTGLEALTTVLAYSLRALAGAFGSMPGGLPSPIRPIPIPIPARLVPVGFVPHEVSIDEPLPVMSA
ncbi:hypothetical protein S40285_10356 [Stachybotrys chlorohalonatus IBT 40285]|uniref:Uncharacterized protein n=1 Tax=Stachybotrys chlorohalonatus (strain IBT 40285) TaxID=1283841 RepID=A0A084QBJ4_STAC4|nr:hypothetical protein S40285_10356 [Stachybotrys chlorohalonata IBT 40285]